jgi:hypothetical protein
MIRQKPGVSDFLWCDYEAAYEEAYGYVCPAWTVTHFQFTE